MKAKKSLSLVFGAMPSETVFGLFLIFGESFEFKGQHDRGNRTERASEREGGSLRGRFSEVFRGFKRL